MMAKGPGNFGSPGVIFVAAPVAVYLIGYGVYLLIGGEAMCWIALGAAIPLVVYFVRLLKVNKDFPTRATAGWRYAHRGRRTIP